MSILAQMKSLHAAEDFFTLLDVPFDASVMNRARLHILKRMGQLIAVGALDGLDEETAFASARAHLETAYGEFVGIAPIEKRLFKVLKDRDPASPKMKGAFVRFDDILPVGIKG